MEKGSSKAAEIRGKIENVLVTQLTMYTLCVSTPAVLSLFPHRSEIGELTESSRMAIVRIRSLENRQGRHSRKSSVLVETENVEMFEWFPSYDGATTDVANMLR
jgi:hypothetical protein